MISSFVCCESPFLHTKGTDMGHCQGICVLLFILSITTSSTWAQKASASLVNDQNQPVGTILFNQTDSGVVIIFDLQGLPGGVHAVHVHNRGQCDPPEFKTAGEHFNPTGKHHGFLNSKGLHAGDLPNIEVDSEGKVRKSIITQIFSLRKNDKISLLTKEGTSIVIHEGPDDFYTDPSGVSGKRIACGTINLQK
jgi:superoxide dismutase, Cu-Zn family